MQLFSTVLNIKEDVDRKMFMDLVREWCENQFFEENRIFGIEWNGEADITYGDENLWLCVRTHDPEDILAIRFEKIQDDVVWDTDYVMNFHTHRLAIRLERSYQENSERTDAGFSAPWFISLLIEKGYLKDDAGLTISDRALIIDRDNADLLAKVIKREIQPALPVVYVSRTYYDEDPADLEKLGRRLRGIAHVFAQKSVFDGKVFQEACDSKNAYHGAVDIFFPGSTQPVRYFCHAEKGADPVLENKIIQKLTAYSSARLLAPLETWNGVNRAILLDQMNEQRRRLAEAEKKSAESANELEDVYSIFGRDQEKMNRRAEEMSRIIASKDYEIQKLREKLNEREGMPVLYSGEEEEFFPDEIREMVLDTLSEKLANLPADSRRAHVLKDLLDHNDYREVHRERAKEIRDLFRDYKTMGSAMRQQLVRFGFVITEEGKHYRLCYYGDPRYKTTVAKSGSDYREGRNIAALITRTML